jgi:TolB protein
MSTRGGGWTWGFFRRAIGGGEYETLAGPDYNQKNFPRPGRNGALIWSIHDEQDKEFLSERTRDGKVRILTEAGEGARWPEYSRDESLVLFTVMDHQVEYWIAENVLNGPSVDTASADEPVQEMQACVVHAHVIDKTGRSPVDLHRR